MTSHHVVIMELSFNIGDMNGTVQWKLLQQNSIHIIYYSTNILCIHIIQDDPCNHALHYMSGPSNIIISYKIKGWAKTFSEYKIIT